ncbi:DUF1971 domain-containing protein [Enterovirga sp.]|uniref:DUF1971 domain-containing protein n=1 Tax=Enterovirga sp. TaxID=2026350 RepID=UPI002FDA8DB7
MSDAPEPWPDGLEGYSRSPDFTEATIPAALQRSHSTKAGVWAKLHLIEGSLRFRDLETGKTQLLAAGVHPVIFPGRLHEVELVGPVRFFVEFHARPAS